MNRTIEEIANEVLRCARSWDGGAMLVGNVEARDIESLARAVLDLTNNVSALNEGWKATEKQLAETTKQLVEAWRSMAELRQMETEFLRVRTERTAHFERAEQLKDEYARVSKMLAETVAARDRAHDKIIKMGARLHELETEREPADTAITRAEQVAQARALVQKWRAGSWTETPNDCADDLEDALEDTLADLCTEAV